jgi:peptidoglycan DL-endopeptidase CwlO
MFDARAARVFGAFLAATASVGSVGCAGYMEQAYAGYGAPAVQTQYGPYAAAVPLLATVGSRGNAAAAVAFAQSQIGTPYCWGGSGPRCYDCSGLTRASWLAGGRVIPRTSEAQVAALPAVAPSDVQPGDILWRPGHVGLYVGQGWVLAATHRGDVVRYQRADGFVRAVRP